MRVKAIFLGSTIAAASYWARQWGYNQREVILISPDSWPHARGLGRDIPVFVCGPQPSYVERDKMLEMVEYFQAVGNTVMDAQEMGEEYRLTLA